MQRSKYHNKEMNERFRNTVLTCYTGKRILVTGGSGFLGTNLIGLLKEVECTIIRLNRNSRVVTPVRWVAQIIDVTADIRLRATWDQTLENVDFIFHFAAQTSVYLADKDVLADMQINALPMLYLLETCSNKDLRPVVLFSGTVTEVGIPTYLPVDERHPDSPITVYDLHKLMAESYLKLYANRSIVRGAILRLANVYGPGPNNSNADRGILNMMIRKAIKGETLTVYGKGDCLRDYVYVEDVAIAFLLAGANIDRLNGHHFVIGSGQGYPLVETFNLVADRVELKTGYHVPVIHIEPPTHLSPIEKRNFVADSHHFTQATGWHASHSLCEGIDYTIQAYM